MKKHCFLIFTLLLAWGGHLSAIPSHVIIIRHAEAATDTGQLSVKGKERAAAYVPYFLETPELVKLGNPAAIFAAIPTKNASGARAVETIKPLADKLQLTVFNKFNSNDYKRLVEEIKTDPAFVGKTLLIVWDHDTIPELARALGAYQTPSFWPPASFDHTWIITMQPSGKATFQNLSQHLMFGDSST